MGVDYGYAIILGVPLREGTTVKRKSRGCAHPEPPTGDFCPQCGRRVWHEGSCSREEFDWELIEREGFQKYSYGDVPIFGMMLYEAELRTGDPKPQRIDFNQTFADAKEEAEDRLKAKLAPLGMWHPEDFGLWVVPWVR